MSKIYDKYLELKSSSNCVSNTLYLFRTGLFYIFIDNDARLVSNLFNLKLGNLNDTVVKCGFPANSLQKYLTLFKSTPYNVEIVSLEHNTSMSPYGYLSNKQFEALTNEILSLEIDNLSISQAYDFLYKIQHELLTFKQGNPK